MSMAQWFRFGGCVAHTLMRRYAYWGIMLYINELSFQRQIDLLRFISNNSTLSIGVWLYPESKVSMIAGLKVTKSSIQPVTEYYDGFKASHTELAKCTLEFLDRILLSKNEVFKNCDSIALYSHGKRDWEVATIGHEGMCLVKDATLFGQLQDEGFSVSSKPPSWW